MAIAGRIGFLGGVNMGVALAKGLLAGGAPLAQQIVVSEKLANNTLPAGAASDSGRAQHPGFDQRRGEMALAPAEHAPAERLGYSAGALRSGVPGGGLAECLRDVATEISASGPAFVFVII
jgi:hypothetical protein